MTVKQSVLKAIYPVLMKAGKWFGIKAGIERNVNSVKPKTSFYNLQATANGGTLISFNDLKGKNVLLVNTASECGYTNQFDELKELHNLYKSDLVIIGFPANDFKEQEKGSNEEIAAFCQVNFGVPFLLAKKSSVVKGTQQNPVYQWLTDKNKNGWNDKAPEWNFSKYLINKQGMLSHYFGPGISPLAAMRFKDNRSS